MAKEHPSVLSLRSKVSDDKTQHTDDDNAAGVEGIGVAPAVDIVVDTQKEEGASDVQHGLVSTDQSNLPAPKKKKNKKRKPASKRGLGAPTGMEPFYADAPMTQAEFAENQELYGREIPFIDRILTAMQRFERTRRLLPERRDVFYKWLHYGGIKVGVNPFSSGLDQESMNKSEMATALSQIQIPDDVREALEGIKSDDPKYAVDFLGCMRGFLSYRALSTYYFATREEVELVTTTLERFMDYLMQHDVCPEYQDDILATRAFCRDATDEIWSVSEAQRWLPGDFNLACSILFGGHYSKIYDGKTYWGELQPGESAFVGFTPEQATQIVGLGIAGAATEEVYEQYAKYIESGDGAELDTIKIITGSGFEIVDLEDATADCKDLYTNNSSEYRPVGRVIAIPWKSPMSPPEDLTDEERKTAQKPQANEPYVFFVEQIILQYLSVGQKIVATIRQLNCGVWFFDEFQLIYPDFELWIPNDLVENYKEPTMMPGAYAPGAVSVSNDGRTHQLEEQEWRETSTVNGLNDMRRGEDDHGDDGDQNVDEVDDGEDSDEAY